MIFVHSRGKRNYFHLRKILSTSFTLEIKTKNVSFKREVDAMNSVDRCTRMVQMRCRCQRQRGWRLWSVRVEAPDEILEAPVFDRRRAWWLNHYTNEKMTDNKLVCEKLYFIIEILEIITFHTNW